MSVISENKIIVIIIFLKITLKLHFYSSIKANDYVL